MDVEAGERVHLWPREFTTHAVGGHMLTGWTAFPCGDVVTVVFPLEMGGKDKTLLHIAQLACQAVWPEDGDTLAEHTLQRIIIARGDRMLLCVDVPARDFGEANAATTTDLMRQGVHPWYLEACRDFMETEGHPAPVEGAWRFDMSSRQTSNAFVTLTSRMFDHEHPTVFTSALKQLRRDIDSNQLFVEDYDSSDPEPSDEEEKHLFFVADYDHSDAGAHIPFSGKRAPGELDAPRPQKRRKRERVLASPCPQEEDASCASEDTMPSSLDVVSMSAEQKPGVAELVARLAKRERQLRKAQVNRQRALKNVLRALRRASPEQGVHIKALQDALLT